jgi:predicted GNAT family acetyltransferase
MAKEKKEKKVVFRRIGGRIVPIAVGVGGAAMAADAARTTRVYNKDGVTIDKKKNVRARLTIRKRADELIIRKNGKRAGYANFSRTDGSDFGFNFLKINKKFRKQGLANILTKQSAVEMKKQGAKTITNQVIHEGSLKSNLSKRDKLFFSMDLGDEVFEQKISKKEAISQIVAAKKGKKRNFWHNPAKDSDVFRETSLKGLRTKGKGFIKPFKTRGMKARIALGSIAAVSSFAYAWRDK